MFEVGRLVARIQLDGTQTFGRDLKQMGTEFAHLDANGAAAARSLVTSFALVATAIVGLVTLAVAKFASFDKAMSAAGAATSATADEQERLRDAAIEAGATTVYTAEKSADAITALGKAGISTANILGGGLAGSLALAAAGQIEVAEAAEIAATTMTQFRLSGEKIPHLADLLAAGAGKAQGGVNDLSLALKQSGLVASQMGLSVEDTIGTLTAFASAGLLGSDAGTSFRTMLLSLANPSAEAKKALKQINVEAYDAQGNFVGIASLAGQLKTGLAGATQATRDQALATIFGSDAIRAANVLYNEGEQGIKDWTAAVDDAGFAAKQASMLQDNLAGDIEKLGGSIDSALIQTGEGANGVLRDMTQWLTSLVDLYGKLDPSIQQFGLVVGVGTAAVVLFGGVLLMTIPKIIEFRLAIQTLNTQMPALRGNMAKVASFLSGPWGIAFLAAAIGVQLLGDYIDSVQAKSEDIDSSLRKAASAAEIFATAGKGSDIKWMSDAASQLKDLNGVLQDSANQDQNILLRFNSTNFGAFDTLKKIGTQLGELATADLPAAQKAFNVLAGETDGSKKRLWELISTMPDFKDALITQGIALGVYAETMTEAEKKTALLELAQGNSEIASEAQSDALSATAIAADGMTLSLEELVDALNAVNGVQITAEEAAIDYAEQLREVAAAAAASNAGISLLTEEGTANRSMLIDLAKAGQDVAQAHLDAGASAADYRNELIASRQAWIDQAVGLGASVEEATKLADAIYRIPTERQIQLSVQDNASGTIDRVFNKLGAFSGQFTAKLKAIPSADGNVLKFYANGGQHEQHVAQVVRAGATRVFNEPETGGELYAPMALSKRPQALTAVRTAVGEWGYDLVPKGAKPGKSSAPSASTTAAPEVRVIVSPKGGIDLLKYIDIQVESGMDSMAHELSGGLNS